jgi:hypothetical protein
MNNSIKKSTIIKSSYNKDLEKKFIDFDSYVCIPISKKKKPVISWKNLSKTPKDKFDPEHNIALITGQINGLTVIDYDRCLDAYIAKKCKLCKKYICYKCEDEGVYDYNLQCYNTCIINAKKLHIKENHASNILEIECLTDKINILREEIESKTYELAQLKKL